MPLAPAMSTKAKMFTGQSHVKTTKLLAADLKGTQLICCDTGLSTDQLRPIDSPAENLNPFVGHIIIVGF